LNRRIQLLSQERLLFLAILSGLKAPLAVCAGSSGATFGQSFAHAADDSTFAFSSLKEIVGGEVFVTFLFFFNIRSFFLEGTFI